MTCLPRIMFPDVVARFRRFQTHYFRIGMCFLSTPGFSDVCILYRREGDDASTHKLATNYYSQPCYRLKMQGNRASSRPFFCSFLLFSPDLVLLTVAANWFCEERSHTSKAELRDGFPTAVAGVLL